MNIFKKTKIITTIGPSTHSKEKIKALFKAGMTTIRLNFSHGGFEEQGERIVFARQVMDELKLPISIMLDTKGPEIRVGKFQNDQLEFPKESTITIYTDSESYKNKVCGPNEMTMSFDIARDLSEGNSILVDDGKLDIEVLDIDAEKSIIKGIARNSHVVKTNKRVNLPGVAFSMDFLSPKDVADIEFACDQNLDYIAASFVNKPEDVLAIREILKRKNAEQIKIISKIESQYAFDNFDAILKVSDGIMVARGDLGLEMPYYEVPFAQKTIIRKSREEGKPVIVATQMLDSMEKSPHPTRAEVTDVYLATELGADSTMLSGESAAGQYPLEAVQVMATINQRAEKEFYHDLYYPEQLKSLTLKTDMNNKRSKIALKLAEKTIKGEYRFAIVLSRTGKLLSEVSRFRPNVIILGLTNDEKQVGKFGITSSVYMSQDTTLFDKVKKDYSLAIEVAKSYGAKTGDKLLIVENEDIYEVVY